MPDCHTTLFAPKPPISCSATPCQREVTCVGGAQTLLQVDSPEVQRIKTLIRYCEARSAGRTCGAKVENLHFLDMPFYETGMLICASSKDLWISVFSSRKEQFCACKMTSV